MKPASIEVRIDELVLLGFSPHDRHVIAEAIQRELALLLETRGLPAAAQRPGERETLRTPPATLPPDAKADKTGAAIAQAIYGGLRE
jgi:hypothetical protein